MGIDKWRGRLATLVKGSDLSMNEISRRAGRAPNYVSNLLSSSDTPTIDSLMGVAEALGTTPVYILHGVEETPESVELIGLFAMLEEDDQEMLISMARRLREAKAR